MDNFIIEISLGCFIHEKNMQNANQHPQAEKQDNFPKWPRHCYCAVDFG